MVSRNGKSDSVYYAKNVHVNRFQPKATENSMIFLDKKWIFLTMIMGEVVVSYMLEVKNCRILVKSAKTHGKVYALVALEMNTNWSKEKRKKPLWKRALMYHGK